MDKQELMDMASLAAAVNDIPVKILHALISTETGWDYRAVRYEPGFRWTVPGSMKPATCSNDTEISLQKHSWGLMQIMGAVARERGLTGWITQLLNPSSGLEWGCKHMVHLRRHHGDKYGWPGIIRAWNTGRPEPSPAGDKYLAKVTENAGGAL